MKQLIQRIYHRNNRKILTVLHCLWPQYISGLGAWEDDSIVKQALDWTLQKDGNQGRQPGKIDLKEGTW